jgi:hypothetical protein
MRAALGDLPKQQQKRKRVAIEIPEDKEPGWHNFDYFKRQRVAQEAAAALVALAAVPVVSFVC